MRATLIILTAIFATTTFFSSSLPPSSTPRAADTLYNHLFTVGIGAGLIGGLYDGTFPYHTLKQHGNFGLGAPDKLDGELVIFEGKIYQTQQSGKTFMVDDRQLTPFAMVHFFQPDRQISIKRPLDKESLFRYLDSLLSNVNGLYAIHIHATFSYLKTRAFPPVKEHDHTPLASMLPLQRFFEFQHATGDLVGYRLPSFMDNTNISGYHFHFLAEQKNAGGHIIDFKADSIKIEIDHLDSYTIHVPSNSDFEQFDFKKTKAEDIKSVERGKQQ